MDNLHKLNDIRTANDYDKEIEAIEIVIKNKENYLAEKHKEVSRTCNENAFLNEVLKDYESYNFFIKKQKEEQMIALQMLHQYLNDLVISGMIKDYDAKDAKIEQKKIVNEIKTIKKSLDNLMN